MARILDALGTHAINTISQPAGKLSAKIPNDSFASSVRDAAEGVQVVGQDSQFDSRTIRNLTNGIPTGGALLKAINKPPLQFLTAAQNGDAIPIKEDWRVRISLGRDSNIFYRDGKNKLMDPLRATDGVVFPYTPDIVVTHMANYNSAAPTHSNYAQHFYNDSQVSDIVITGEFTVQNVDEGRYLMAATQFFRSATKMFFGRSNYVGNPPPVVFLNGYGELYFPNVPCVITNFSQRLSNDVDYIEIPINTGSSTTYDNSYADKNGNSVIIPKAYQLKKQVVTTTENVRVPAATQFTVTVRPVYSRSNLASNFDLHEFASGKLLGKDGNGGFI